MKSAVSKPLTRLVIFVIVIFTFVSCAVNVSAADESSITDIIGETDVMQYDPLRLINLSILKNIPFNTVSYEGKTILNVLNEKQASEFVFCETTVSAYSEAYNNAKSLNTAGANIYAVIQEANKAFSLYSNHIADIAQAKMTNDEIEEAVYNYIKTAINEETNIGDIKGQLPSIACNYTLMSISVKEKIEETETMTSYGPVYQTLKKIVSDKTTWFTNGASFDSLFNGTVTKIDDTSITISIGSTELPLTITYSTEDQIQLLDKNLAVGDYVKQGTSIISGDNSLVTVEIIYGADSIDLLYLLGPSAKLLVSEYARVSTEEYSYERNQYIDELLDYEFISK